MRRGEVGKDLKGGRVGGDRPIILDGELRPNEDDDGGNDPFYKMPRQRCLRRRRVFGGDNIHLNEGRGDRRQ